MKKNSLFFTFVALFFAAAIFVSCQKEDFSALNADVDLKSTQVGSGDAYSDLAWENYCITCAGPYLSKAVTGTYQGGQTVTVTIHNTSTHIVYSFSGEWSSYNSGQSANPLSVALDANWAAGNTIAQSFTFQRTPGGGGGAGNTVVVNTFYNLIGICTTTSINVTADDPVCVDDTEVTVTGTVASCGSFTGGTIKIQEYIAGNWTDVSGASENVTLANKEVVYTYTPDAVGTRTFRAVYSGGGNGYNASQSLGTDVEAVICECDESFSYVDNGNGSYTFTFVPDADMTGAELVFTFPQGALDGNPLPGWTYNGQTMQTTMDLEECETYTWTVSLSCKDLKNPQNKWTDFKVNGVSLKDKYELSNIKCD
jgi:hypothetical protein